MDQDSENGSQAESTITETSIEPSDQHASSARNLTLEEFMATRRENLMNSEAANIEFHNRVRTDEENQGPARGRFLLRRRIPFGEMSLEEFLVRAGTLPPNFAPINNEARVRAGGRGFGQVVDKRQRRMIRNRESAARSRSRKQAYTVELEAEVNQLKEENELLKQALVEYERKRRQQLAERAKESEVWRAREKLLAVRRCSSCDY